MTVQMSSGTSTQTNVRQAKARILVIDDSPSVILHTRRVLGAVGYEVETLNRLVDLPHRVKTEPPDLILLDLHMPALPGVTFAGFIRKYQSTHIPIVVYSSRPREELDDAAAKIDAAAVVEKGGPDILLISAVNRALREARLALRSAKTGR